MSEFDPVSYIMGAKSGSGGGGGGGSSGITIVGIVWDDAENTYTADMKAGEMYAAAQNSVLVLREVGYDAYHVVVNFSLDHGVYAFSPDSSVGVTLEANSADDYPTGGF